MEESRNGLTIGRRQVLLKLTAIAASFAGLSAFKRGARVATALRAPKWDDQFELAVDLEVAQQQGGRSHRPYVAVWVEDASGKPVRTLSLWVNRMDRGPRYISELRQWFDSARQVAKDGGTDLISTISGATRMPGQYTVVWNGRDDRGNVVDQGNYRVVIEAAREHGSYQLMHQNVVIGATPVTSDLPGNQEIGKAHVEYRRRK